MASARSLTRARTSCTERTQIRSACLKAPSTRWSSSCGTPCWISRPRNESGTAILGCLLSLVRRALPARTAGRPDTSEIGRVVGAPRPLPLRHLRIRTQWTGPLHTAGRVRSLILGRNDLRRSHAVLHPLFYRAIDVVLCVAVHLAGLAEAIRTRPSAAMLHSRHHEQTNELIGLLGAHLRHHALVVLDCVRRRNRGIAPSVINDQLPSAILELLQVRIRRVQYLANFVIGHFHIVLNRKRLDVPVRIVKHHVLEKIRAERILQALAGPPAADPTAPPVRSGFTTGAVAQIHRLALGILWPGVDFFQRADLRLG